ncbi:hypothetical protein [Patulibacter minatonensis]|uniref:hypothetical protein n=1 Tax=Patulibacter minatonensis TaxID=298163 RepID=UPI0004B53680|nr:hypothetical protein [Patulibacter minatonensis]
MTWVWLFIAVWFLVNLAIVIGLDRFQRHSARRINRRPVIGTTVRIKSTPHREVHR